MQFEQKYNSCFQAQNKKILQNFECVDGLCKKSLNDWNWVFCIDENTSLREVIRNEYIANTLLNVFA